IKHGRAARRQKSTAICRSPAAAPFRYHAGVPERETVMPRLLLLLLLLFTLPASAGLFDARPAPVPGGAPLSAPLNNSSDFLPVAEAFRLSLVESDDRRVKLRFVNAEGYYLYRHRFQFRSEPAGLLAGEAQLPAGQAKHDEYFGDVEVYY